MKVFFCNKYRTNEIFKKEFNPKWFMVLGNFSLCNCDKNYSSDGTFLIRYNRFHTYLHEDKCAILLELPKNLVEMLKSEDLATRKMAMVVIKNNIDEYLSLIHI